ncbi:MAG TPA: hypothetical protein VE621_13210 [Bryobacteraceae bacterium]|nr:hypothetical protein [Bryobacteraceae bacterium]
MFIRIGDQVINTRNIVSIDIDGSDIVRIWYVGSTTPIMVKPTVPAAAVLQVLQSNEWLV